jgi:hypothetical protein
MNARTNDLAWELARLRRAHQQQQPGGVLADRIHAIEAELDRSDYQFHAVACSVRS